MTDEHTPDVNDARHLTDTSFHDRYRALVMLSEAPLYYYTIGEEESPVLVRVPDEHRVIAGAAMSDIYGIIHEAWTKINGKAD